MDRFETIRKSLEETFYRLTNRIDDINSKLEQAKKKMKMN